MIDLFITLIDGSIVVFLGQVYFIFADSLLLQLQHLLAAVHAAIINSCESTTAYDFFFIWSINVFAVLQCSTVLTFNQCVCAC